MTHVLKFDKCETRRCVNVTVNNDVTLEQEESFFITVTLDSFYYWPPEGEIKIMDDKDECKNLYNTNESVMYPSE